MEPCGTPVLLLTSDEWQSPMETLLVRPVKYDSSQFMTWPESPHRSVARLGGRSWFSISNVALISDDGRIVGLPLSTAVSNSLTTLVIAASVACNAQSACGSIISWFTSISTQFLQQWCSVAVLWPTSYISGIIPPVNKRLASLHISGANTSLPSLIKEVIDLEG